MRVKLRLGFQEFGNTTSDLTGPQLALEVMTAHHYPRRWHLHGLQWLTSCDSRRECYSERHASGPWSEQCLSFRSYPASFQCLVGPSGGSWRRPSRTRLSMVGRINAM
jgi:hypothetical protein